MMMMVGENTDQIRPDRIRRPPSHVSNDLDQVVCRAAGVTDALHGGKQVRRGVAQQHAHLVGLTSVEKNTVNLLLIPQQASLDADLHWCDLHLLSHLLEVVKELQGDGQSLSDQTAAFSSTPHEPGQTDRQTGLETSPLTSCTATITFPLHGRYN